MPERQKPASKVVTPPKAGMTNIEKAQADSKAEAAKMEALKQQSNVEVSEDSSVVTMGVDEYDRWVKEYFKMYAAPGFTPNFTREDFPDFGDGPIAVSRCYFNKVDGKHLVLDILEDGEYSPTQIKQIQATLRARGFHYTWTIKGEDTSLEEVFKVRMLAKNELKPQKVSVKQTNVVEVLG
jgi:hypothetical protein